MVDSLTQVASLVQDARDVADLMHNTYIRIKLDKALEVLAKAEVEFNKQEYDL